MRAPKPAAFLAAVQARRVVPAPRVPPDRPAEASLASRRERWAQVPTLASTSARRNFSMTSMKATEGTRRMRAVIEAIW